MFTQDICCPLLTRNRHGDYTRLLTNHNVLDDDKKTRSSWSCIAPNRSIFHISFNPSFHFHKVSLQFLTILSMSLLQLPNEILLQILGQVLPRILRAFRWSVYESTSSPVRRWKRIDMWNRNIDVFVSPNCPCLRRWRITALIPILLPIILQDWKSYGRTTGEWMRFHQALLTASVQWPNGQA